MLTVLNRGERGAPLDSSAEEMAGRLLMNYADGTKHGEAAAKSINAGFNLTEKKSDSQKVCGDVESGDVCQRGLREEGDKDKDKPSKECHVTESVENSREREKVANNSREGVECERNEKEKQALGFYRVLRNPVEINGDGNTEKEMNKINTGGKNEDEKDEFAEEGDIELNEEKSIETKAEKKNEKENKAQGEKNEGDEKVDNDGSKESKTKDNDLSDDDEEENKEMQTQKDDVEDDKTHENENKGNNKQYDVGNEEHKTSKELDKDDLGSDKESETETENEDVPNQEIQERANKEDTQKNENKKNSDKWEETCLESENSDAPIAIDEDLTTYTELSADEVFDDNEEDLKLPDIELDGIPFIETTELAISSETAGESSYLLEMEKELKIAEVKFKELAREIKLLEKYIEAGGDEIERLEFELSQVESGREEKLQYKEDLEKYISEENRLELVLQVTSEKENIKESISCVIEDSKMVEPASNEEMETGETPKTEEETFFSFTPSEDEKTFSVNGETTRDVATETEEDEIVAKVEENHSDLLLNCLVRYRPSSCPSGSFLQNSAPDVLHALLCSIMTRGLLDEMAT